jgi:hypothetical protein
MRRVREASNIAWAKFPTIRSKREIANYIKATVKIWRKQKKIKYIKRIRRWDELIESERQIRAVNLIFALPFKHALHGEIYFKKYSPQLHTLFAPYHSITLDNNFIPPSSKHKTWFHIPFFRSISTSSVFLK